MGSTNVSITEVARNLSDYINRSTYRGEHFILTRGNKPVVEIRPIAQARRLGDLPSIFKSLPRLDAKELSEFEKDIKNARKKIAATPERYPWDM